ncbi:hypothetical protein D3C85_879970 [compost metagenome]
MNQRKDLFFLFFACIGRNLRPEVSDALVEIVETQHANVLAIKPKETLLVKSSAAALYPLKAKLFYEFLESKYFLFRAIVPSHACEEVKHCFGKNSLVFVLLYTLCAVSLAELLFTIWGHDVREACKHWPFNFKCIIE